MGSNVPADSFRQLRSLSDVRNKNLLRTQGLIDGQWVNAASGRTFNLIDPATGEKIAAFPEMDRGDTARAIESAAEAFKTWKTTSGRERARMLKKWNDLCLENAEDFALILTLETGKPIWEARGEVTYACSFIEWFAGEAERTHGENIPTANRNQRLITTKQPIGVVGCLIPWNYPMAMITRKVCAALAAGCTTVWKAAGETPLSAGAMAVLALEAGIPPQVIQIITTLNTVAEVGKEICTHKAVRKVSFTGSTRVGKLLMEQCAPTLKKLSLELGGNSPFIVFDDANVDVAVDAAIMAKFRNSGQTCVAANRIFVQSGIYAEFSKALVDKIRDFKVGHGTHEDVMVGPLTHENGALKVLTHIEEAKAKGRKVILGGSRVEGSKGYFITPTIITSMPRGTITSREEVFGPVIPLYKFGTEEEVIELANSVEVGLGSFIMTSSMPRQWRVAEALEVGLVGVNIGLLSAAENPFGGVKQSGFGKEGGREGIDEYLVTKSIFLNVASG
ncbi:succinate-semialdehyde dehydrogenase [Xylogone sp. PMI_703]|nr:succinate-semialdehyde dehydrogenase [Xylogone sp. PMI_703]